MHKGVLLALSVLFSLYSYCQNEASKGASGQNTAISKADTGTIYALVVGVSRYEDATMPQLQFADSDAIYFAKLLRAGLMGKTDSANIKLLTNESATDNNIKKERQWILRRIKPGDKVYIYLSGHGDAINSEAVYFLSHNTPKVSDKSEYTFVSNIDMLQMQTVIKMFIEQQAKVFLITDFCRTNELVGKETSSRFLYTNVMGQEIPGLTKMVSCSADEFSFEDKKWGNGRGVFSFYLINGLLGLADNPTNPNGEVSFAELENYVKTNVAEDTKSPTTGEGRQTPVFKGDKQTICKTNETVKQQLIAQKGNNSDYLAMITKGNKPDDIADTALYLKFMAAISEKRLIEPYANSATYYLNLLLKTITNKITTADLTDELLVALLDEGQKPINYYSQGLLDSIRFNYDYFMDASKYFEAALPYLSNNKELYDRANASNLFLKARALKESHKREDWNKGLLLADSALQIKPGPYLYHTKGLLHFKLKQLTEAELCQRKAMASAGGWAFPYYSISDIFQRNNQPDSAYHYYYEVAKKISPNAYPHEEYNDSSSAYALIVGVSKYEDSHIPSLRYADKDAIYFADMLNTGLLGEIEPENVMFYINEAATYINIMSQLNRIMKKAQQGDKVYIYLSGLGDLDFSTPFFLLYDTRMADKEMDFLTGGALNLETLMTYIKKLTAEKGAEVILVTDFSYSAKLADEIPLGKDVFGEGIKGLTLIRSCQTGESSFEDVRWGGGHGVFTYHLVTGLYGLADRNMDGRVNIAELSAYVRDKVADDTYDAVTYRRRQTPVFSGEWHKVLSRVNEKEVKKLKSEMFEDFRFVPANSK